MNAEPVTAGSTTAATTAATATTVGAVGAVGERTRARILDAAAALLCGIGLTRTTTKEIARAAGCSEAALYKHFRDKEEIFVRVLRERAPQLSGTLVRLSEQAGRGEVRSRLVEVARLAVAFYREAFPMAASLFASPELLAAHRRRLAEDGAGPHEVSRHLADYLAAEQRLGRIAPDVDPDAVALLLIGACFHRAFLERFYADEIPDGAPRPEDADEFAEQAVHALLGGLAVPD
jgi:AcrR family transcriptional regulator